MIYLTIGGLLLLAIGITLIFRASETRQQLVAAAAATVGLILIGYSLAEPIAGLLEHGL